MTVSLWLCGWFVIWLSWLFYYISLCACVCMWMSVCECGYGTMVIFYGYMLKLHVYVYIHNTAIRINWKKNSFSSTYNTGEFTLCVCRCVYCECGLLHANESVCAACVWPWFNLGAGVIPEIDQFGRTVRPRRHIKGVQLHRRITLHSWSLPLNVLA